MREHSSWSHNNTTSIGKDDSTMTTTTTTTVSPLPSNTSYVTEDEASIAAVMRGNARLTMKEWFDLGGRSGDANPMALVLCCCCYCFVSYNANTMVALSPPNPPPLSNYDNMATCVRLLLECGHKNPCVVDVRRRLFHTLGHS
jgi:hypothetical protein